MNESGLIIDSLRNQLRLRGLTYKDLAKHWKLSVSSVKRIMSGDDISLQKIESACELMDISLPDFFSQVTFQRDLDFIYLSSQQEEVLAKDPRLMQFFALLHEGWTASQILEKYTLSKAEVTRFLLQLDKIKVIELLPNNRVKKKLQGPLRFRKDGPLARQLKTLAKSQFLDSDFKNDSEYMTFLSFKLTSSDLLKLKSQLIQLSKDLTAKSDRLHTHPNTQEYGLIVGLRPWVNPFLSVLKLRDRKT